MGVLKLQALSMLLGYGRGLLDKVELVDDGGQDAERQRQQILRVRPVHSEEKVVNTLFEKG